MRDIICFSKIYDSTLVECKFTQNKLIILEKAKKNAQCGVFVHQLKINKRQTD